MIRFNIKALRSANGNMSQKELQEKSGIRPSTLSAYENSSAKTINIEHIDKLCEIFNCQPAELMTYVPDGISDIDKFRFDTFLMYYLEKERSQIQMSEYVQDVVKELQKAQKAYEAQCDKPLAFKK